MRTCPVAGCARRAKTGTLCPGCEGAADEGVFIALDDLLLTKQRHLCDVADEVERRAS